MLGPFVVVSVFQWLVALGVFCSLQGRFSRLATLLFLAPLAYFLLLYGVSFGLLVFAQSLALVLLLLVCSPWASKSTFAGLSLVACTGLFVAVSAHAFREVARHQRENPIVSIVDRLDYERSRPLNAIFAQPEAAYALGRDLAATVSSSTIEKALGAAEYRRQIRDAELHQIHREVELAFARAAGFGVGRMVSHHFQLANPRGAATPIPLGSPPLEEARSAEAEENSGSAQHQAAPLGLAMDRLRNLQINSLVDFVNVPGQGYFESRQSVLGFQPHGFSKRPALQRADEPGRDWRVARIELVSLLKHDSPGVYLSKYLPAMDQLRDAKVRPLDRFEESALARLYGGEDLIVRSTTTQIRMLGSIRAQEQCLQCHSVERGNLLGAFSYHLALGSEPERQRPELSPAPPPEGAREELPVRPVL